MFKGKFKDIVQKENGFLRGPFGGDLKKSIFVPKSDNTFKVYEQGVVLQANEKVGKYYISNQYFKEKMYKFEVKPGDFLVSCSGVNYGAIFRLPKNIEKGIINQALLRIRLNEELVDADYFFYYFKSYISKVIVGGTGDSTVPNFPPMDVVKNISISLPSLKEQKKRASILEKIDKKISTNNKLNSELESIAKTIYDYWFLQFEFPNEEGKPYKSSGGKMVWNDELKREIPEGWNIGYISKYISKEKSGDWGKDEEIGNYIEKVSCIRGADLSSICNFEELKVPTRYILSKNTDKILKNGELVVEISGGSPTQSTGRICYINGNVIQRFENPLIASNFCRAFSLKNNKYVYYFYLMWQNLYENNLFFNYESKTTGIKNLLFDIFVNEYKIVLLPLNLIEIFNERVETMFDKIQKNILENQELASLRDFLLPLLMNGQVKFKDNIKEEISYKEVEEKEQTLI